MQSRVYFCQKCSVRNMATSWKVKELDINARIASQPFTAFKFVWTITIWLKKSFTWQTSSRDTDIDIIDDDRFWAINWTWVLTRVYQLHFGVMASCWWRWWSYMTLAISAVNLKFGEGAVCCFNEVFDLYKKNTEKIFSKARYGNKLTEKLS
jgi:hypothetical protein